MRRHGKRNYDSLNSCNQHIQWGISYTLCLKEIFIVPPGSKLTSEQLEPHPQYPSHQPGPSSSPPAKRRRTDKLQPPKHTMQACDFQHNHQTPGVQTSAVDTYASYLKSVYTQEKLKFYDKWPLVKSKKYINLALIEKEDITKPEAYQFMTDTIHGNIDDIKKSKRATDIGQIAQLPDGSQPKCILVEGAPGVGKSTFAWKLCRKWGKGKLLQQYQLVVLLRLRDKSVRAAKNISDLFQYRDPQIQQAAVEEIQRTWGKRVFLLFEGYDELPEELRNESSVFLDVIIGRELPEATVLITSRPWASEFLHRDYKGRISQHIEILGFTKDNIQSYLESTIPNDPSLLADLKKYISCYPHINSMMYIPLNSAIVVEVYRNSRKDKSLVPKTMTELYSSLFRSLLLRHLFDHPVHGKKRDWSLQNFSDLPQDVYQQLCELGRIAYEGICNDQQVIFHQKDFETLGLSLEKFETLGLMQRVRELYVDEGAAVSYNFLHLTVQEYLAAFHLSQQPVAKQIEHFREYKENEFGFDSVSVKASDDSDVESSGNSDHESDIESEDDFSYEYHIEASDDSAVESSSDSNHESDIESEDDFSYQYHIEASDDSDIELDVNHQRHHHLHMVLRFLCGVSKFDGYPSEVLSTLCIERSDDDMASVIYEVPFDTLHWLFEARDCDVIANLLGTSDIQLFEQLSQITPFDCFVLGYCVSHSNRTWKIHLEQCSIGDKEVEMLVRGAVEKKVQCTGGITEINLSENDITSEGVKHLLNFPKKWRNKLEKLDLASNMLDSQFCVTLAHLIPHVPQLKKLNLSCNPNIGQGGAVPLITSLTGHNSHLRLSLDETGIGVEDCRALSELLSSSTSLKELRTGHNALPPEAVEQIISGLHHNTTLKKVNMVVSHFSLQNTISLASVLRTNHTLVYLDLEQCDIDSDGACQLASALCTNDTLQYLYLQHNPIGVKGATAFAETLLKNKSLKVLDLRNDSIGEEGAQKLIDSLTHNTTVEELWLPLKYKSSISRVGRRVRFRR